MDNGKDDELVLFVRVNDSDEMDAFVEIDSLFDEVSSAEEEVDTKEETVDILEEYLQLKNILKGDKGDKGDRGFRGLKGDKGEPGEPGVVTDRTYSLLSKKVDELKTENKEMKEKMEAIIELIITLL